MWSWQLNHSSRTQRRLLTFTTTDKAQELKFNVKVCESSFPLEMFLLFGDNYVKDGKLGSSCHKKRVAFEENLRKLGKKNTLKNFYRSLATLNLGRQISVYCTK